MEIGPDVETYAKTVLEKQQILKVSDGGDGLPFLDSYGSDSEITSLLNSGLLKDIYGTDEE